MTVLRDGPASRHFAPVPVRGTHRRDELKGRAFSKEMREAAAHAPHGRCVAWGIAFEVRKLLVVRREMA